MLCQTVAQSSRRDKGLIRMLMWKSQPDVNAGARACLVHMLCLSALHCARKLHALPVKQYIRSLRWAFANWSKLAALRCWCHSYHSKSLANLRPHKQLLSVAVQESIVCCRKTAIDDAVIGIFAEVSFWTLLPLLLRASQRLGRVSAW
eukprot:393841-Amphidinium_carterae.1